MSLENMIYFNQVNFSYGSHQVLYDLSFSVDRGEFICLTGKSGCGKSTLLRLINGLLDRQDGDIRILGKKIGQWEIHELRRKMGYVLQEGALFPHLTAYQNMCYVMKLNKASSQQCENRISELLPLVNLERDVLNKFPDKLSGGQRQRVGIVRAIAHNPEMVLMDEPFSALDSHTRKSLQDLVKNIHQKLNTTFVMVTHDKEEANLLATRVIRMAEGQIKTLI
ncbi:ATP-binding cassette domain-containing protein [Saccharicrinis fermentans]|uniref:Fe(3+) ions import ATP-binding protein FbpC 2 n=1 Tax=Saccharicrinis fermentans DSM 9555 = JCM 21142 TaxID=869213 RepID=W7XXW4_9BACT|nr:ATP-binding cassette domain-containing protein [Saccharicrinis fermentans]GAF03360.1 Fe(3+) ions import ATP-binding protein FbpC 2 [Saccharicrinis fermentans DSM 9555 = JCM 21142]